MGAISPVSKVPAQATQAAAPPPDVHAPVEALIRARDASHQRVAELMREKAELANLQDDTAFDLEVAQHEITTLKHEQAGLRSANETLSAKLAEQEKNAAALIAAQARIASLTEVNRIATAQSAAENAATDVGMQEHCAQLTTEVAALKEALRRGEDYVQRIETENAELSTLREQKERAEKARLEIEEAIAAAHQETQNSQAREQATLAKMAELSTRLAEQTDRAARAEEAVQTARASQHRCETLTVELDVLKDALNSAERSLQQLTRENSTKEQDIARLQKAVGSLRGDPSTASLALDAPSASDTPTTLRISGSLVFPAPEISDAVSLVTDVVLYKSLLEEVPEALKKVRRCLQYFLRHPDDLNLLHELVRHTESMSEKTEMPEFDAFHRLCLALGALMRDLYARPDQVNPPLLRTVCQSFDFLGVLFEQPNRSRVSDLGRAKVLAVDDDAGILDALGAALEMVDLKMEGVSSGRDALEFLERKSCDLIFLDVGLSEMSGLELCEQIRQIPNHARTPIVFLTGLATIENRVQSSLKGANDFICKPFNLLELDVKALSWLLKKRLDLL